MVGERPKRASKSHFLLIFEVHKDLVITRITIQKTIVFMLSQALHHLINKWKWEMIIPGGGIQLAVIYACYLS
jgi:hypothetical protein